MRRPRAERYTPLSGSFGHHLTGTMTGPGGAFPGLGQAGAGNARVRTRGPLLPGWSDRSGSNVLPRPRKPGLELRPRAESPDGKSRGGTPIGERTRWCAPHREMRRLETHVCRRSASFFLSLGRVGRAKRNPPLSMVGYAAELVIGPATSGRTRWRLTHLCFAKTRAHLRRENDVACSPLPACGERSSRARVRGPLSEFERCNSEPGGKAPSP